MKRRLPTKKILVASLGVGAVSYVLACGASSSSPPPGSGNLMPPADSGNADVVSSGNLMAPIDSGNDAPIDSSQDTGADVSSSGNLMAPPDATPDAPGADGEASDAGDGGGDPSVGLTGPVAFDKRGVLFELEMVGGAFERRYRKMRPELDEMPWGTLDLRGIPEAEIVSSRKSWTGAAFQEYRTAVACAATLRALLECKAPVDIIALATRFPLDEMSHVELCGRMAMEVGGGTELRFDPDRLILDADPRQPPLVRAAELVTRFFCVGEALSIPLIRGTWHASAHPLPRAVLGRIVRDEAAHGTFGFTFLDWAVPELDEQALAHVGRHADMAIGFIKRQWGVLAARAASSFDAKGNALGWMSTGAYLELARRSMRGKVVGPLRERGVPIGAWTAEDDAGA